MRSEVAPVALTRSAGSVFGTLAGPWIYPSCDAYGDFAPSGLEISLTVFNPRRREALFFRSENPLLFSPSDIVDFIRTRK